MSNYNGNIEKRKAAQDLMKNRRENTSKYFFDLSKLTFAALVLGVGSALLNRWDERYHVVASYILVFFIYWNVYRYSICFDWV